MRSHSLLFIYFSDKIVRNNFLPLFSATLCLPLPLSLKLSFYLFVVDIVNTFTHLQSVGNLFRLTLSFILFLHQSLVDAFLFENNSEKP